LHAELESLRHENQRLRKAIDAYSHRGTLIEARRLPTEPLARLRADNTHLRFALEFLEADIDLKEVLAFSLARKRLGENVSDDPLIISHPPDTA
jgi:hypothetical protein